MVLAMGPRKYLNAGGFAVGYGILEQILQNAFKPPRVGEERGVLGAVNCKAWPLRGDGLQGSAE
jgi:hypothetical protein